MSSPRIPTPRRPGPTIRSFHGSCCWREPPAPRGAGSTLPRSVARTGPLHTHQYDPSQPYTNSGGTYDYRYQRGTTLIDVLWRPNDSVQVVFPVQPGVPITRIDRDGASTPLTPAGGVVQLTLS